MPCRILGDFLRLGMLNDSSTPPSASAITEQRGSVRHLWFPVLVVGAAAAWLVYRALDVRYMTASHLLVVLVSAMLVSGWYVGYGGQAFRTRVKIVSAGWLVVMLLLVVFKPIYNGDMGIHGWRLRFAGDQVKAGVPTKEASEIADWQTTPRDYPGFLGGGYWPEVKGVQLDTDWVSHPPQLVWRHEIGAGWSSFAIVGNYAFTQEQRGDSELVSCYRLDTGEPVWTHADAARFDPADFQGGLGGIGPRATPTIVDGKVYTQGGTGIVNCLDGRSGKVLWSHDTIEETGAAVTIWGKSGSPLVVDGMVIVSVGGAGGP